MPVAFRTIHGRVQTAGALRRNGSRQSDDPNRPITDTRIVERSVH
jgi:hypothetical protein